MGYDGTLVVEFLARTHQTSLLTDREKHLIGTICFPGARSRTFAINRAAVPSTGSLVAVDGTS